jgi:hypothetical protein
MMCVCVKEVYTVYHRIHEIIAILVRRVMISHYLFGVLDFRNAYGYIFTLAVHDF